ncbi:MAG: 4Fe-4S binding protein [Nitrososphaerales archaeon]
MKVKLRYSHEVASKPILAEIILKTGLLINILEAKLTPKEGEMVIDIATQGSALKNALQQLRSSGLEVIELRSLVEVDKGLCISCGACISPCPSKAISFDENLDIEIDAKRCIGCGICVKACPRRAIQLI